MVKLISLFSGCGGMDLPFHQSGFETVWANDSNKYACQTFRTNIAETIVNDSIENIDIAAVPEAEIIIGGFPCQDFSMIWKRPGLQATRGNLYTYFLEFVKQKQPKVFIAAPLNVWLKKVRFFDKRLDREIALKQFIFFGGYSNHIDNLNYHYYARELFPGLRMFKSIAIESEKPKQKEEVPIEGFVYLIGCQETKTLKIGFTQCLEKRLEALQCANPFELKLLGYKRGGSIQLEKVLHKKFKTLRLKGEWFKWDKTILQEFKVSN